MLTYTELWNSATPSAQYMAVIFEAHQTSLTGAQVLIFFIFCLYFLHILFSLFKSEQLYIFMKQIVYFQGVRLILFLALKDL